MQIKTKAHSFLPFVLFAMIASNASSSAALLFDRNSTWKYFKGTSEASSPDTTAWRGRTFNDSTFTTGPGPFWYGDVQTGGTQLTDMINTYACVFLRKTFVIDSPASVSALRLGAFIDDGFVAWVNGVEIARVGVSDPITKDTLAVNATEPPPFLFYDFPNPSMLVAGTNVIAIQVFNTTLNSSDLGFDASLESTIDQTAPTVLATDPVQGATVIELPYVGVTFSENVTGVDAADLLVNGVGATNVVVISPREYQFRFPSPPTGSVQVAFRSSHGITDLASPPNAFAGANWSYTLNPNVVTASALISEFMSDNTAGIKDDDGSRSDWIEIYNPGPLDLNLSGWFLTDSSTNLTQWRFPSVNIAANKYLVVWASAKDRINPAAPLHTNFKLSKNAGSYLALVNPQTNVVSAFTSYPAQSSDVSYGRDRVDPTLVGYYTTPTPGAQNSTSGSGFVGEPVFSVNSGIYTNASLSVSITAPAGTTIRYTLNGTVPTNTSTAYSSPITFTTNLIIKARAYPTGATNLLPSQVVARNYIFLDNTTIDFNSNLPVLIIDTMGRAIPADVAPGQSRVEGTFVVLDNFRGRTSVRNHPDFQGSAGFEVFGQTSAGFAKKPLRIEIHDAIGNDLDVPILGMPADADWRLRNPFDDKSYLNDFLGFEIFDKMGHYSVRRKMVETFIDAGGGRLNYAADYYGIMTLVETIKQSSHRVDINEVTPYSTNGTAITGGYIFKKDKDSTGDLSFSTTGSSALGFSAETLKLHEPKPNSVRVAQGVTSSWPGPGYTPSGSNQLAYLNGFLNQMEAALYATDWLTRTGTNHYSSYMDVERFVDFHWLVEFTKQIDGYRLSSYFSKDRNGKVGPGPIWDWNLSFGNANYLRGGWTNVWYYEEQDQGMTSNEHIWLRRLINGTATLAVGVPGPGGDPDFNQKIADRWSFLRTNVLGLTNIIGRIDEMSTTLNEAAQRDAWGPAGKYRSSIVGVYQWPNPNGTADGRDVDFQNPTNYLGPIGSMSIIGQMKKWVTGRFLWIDSQFTPTPIFSSAGGQVGTGTTITISPPPGATLYYTMNGTDPRAPGGNVAAGALSNTGPATVTIASNARIVARAKKAGTWYNTWSGAGAATLYTAIPALRVTELMFHPAPPPSGSTNSEDDFEYIELKNIGTASLNLTGFRFTNGIDFNFTGGGVTNLAAGARVLVVKNRAAFSSRYGTVANIAGEYDGNFDNSGERVTLVGPFDEPILDFEYSDGWYPVTDGLGFSLVIKDENAAPGSWTNPASWRISGLAGGSPGQPDSAAPAVAPILINEALTHSDPLVDRIELYNPTTNTVNIGGWFLSDDFQTPRKYRIPAGTTIPAGGYLVFAEDQFNATNSPTSFSLSSHGDEVYLFSGDGTNLTGYAHGFSFGAAPNGVSFGRYVTSLNEEHFVAQSTNTLGAANAAPRVGPIVISEVMYRPPDVLVLSNFYNDSLDEYIELHNITTNAVALFDPAYPTNTWKLRDAVDFVFPTNATIAAGARVLVVSFDPLLQVEEAAGFRATYRLSTNVVLYGPYQGSLDNSGASIELVRPDVPEPVGFPDAGFVPYYIADKVHYSDQAPWPVAADGVGPSLHRLNVSAFGNDVANWIAALPTPGLPYIGGTPPAITGQPVNQTVVAGSNVTFTVTASGAQSYQWRFNGANVVGATNATLTLTNVQAGQAGSYLAVALNSASALSSSNATLTVLIPASIVSQPQSQSVGPGTNVTFAVGATSERQISYQWRIDGANIPGATNSSLTITNPQPVNDVYSHDYRVLVTDSISSILSDPATLLVLVKPVITLQPQPITAFVGDNVTFSVIVTGTPPFGFRWRKNGATITTITSTSGTGTYTIPNVQLTNAATYSVVITNIALLSPGVLSSNAVLTVSNAPLLAILGSPKLLSDGTFRLTLGGGDTNQNYVIEATTNLINWIDLVTNRPGQTPWIDTNAVNYKSRYYRARQLP